MSAETKAALDAAIEAHMRDTTQGGALVTAYVVYAAYVNTEIEEGKTGYRYIVADGQPYHSTLGLGQSLVSDLVMPQMVEHDDD